MGNKGSYRISFIYSTARISHTTMSYVFTVLSSSAVEPLTECLTSYYRISDNVGTNGISNTNTSSSNKNDNKNNLNVKRSNVAANSTVEEVLTKARQWSVNVLGDAMHKTSITPDTELSASLTAMLSDATDGGNYIETVIIIT